MVVALLALSFDFHAPLVIYMYVYIHVGIHVCIHVYSLFHIIANTQTFWFSNLIIAYPQLTRIDCTSTSYT